MADSRQLTVNGFGKSKLVPVRFEKDAAATPEVSYVPNFLASILPVRVADSIFLPHHFGR